MKRIGKVGELSEELETEYLVWRIVHSGQSLSEVKTWTIIDLEKFISYSEMTNDYETALGELARRDSEKATKSRQGN